MRTRKLSLSILLILFSCFIINLLFLNSVVLISHSNSIPKGSLELTLRAAPILENLTESDDPLELGGTETIWVDAWDADTGISQVMIEFNAINHSMAGPNGNTWNYTSWTPSIGVHAYTIWANDTDGNWTSIIDNITVVDTTAPVLSAGGTDINYGLGAPGPIWVTWTWTDLDFDNYTITRIGVGVVDSGTWFSGVPLQWDVSGLGLGIYTFRCEVEDGSGNLASDNITVTVPDGLPILTAGGTNIAYELGAAGPFTATWTWTDLLPSEYNITRIGFGIVDSGTWSSGVPITWDVTGLGLGVHTFRCDVDDLDNLSDFDDLTVTVTDTTAPVLSAGGADINYDLGAAGPFMAMWTWNDLDPMTYTITRIGVGVIDSGAWSSGTPITWDVTGLPEGTHTFRCYVIDGSTNSDYDDVVVNVIVETIPWLSAGGTNIAYELGAPGPFTASWTWTDNNPDKYNITRIGVGIVDSGTWSSGVPITWDVTGLGLGVHTFRCDVDDLAFLSNYDDLTVTVTDTTAPVLSAGGTNINYNLGDPGPITAMWTWTDLDPDSYTITKVGVGVLDSGAWISSVPITWDVSGLSSGYHVFTCTVDDFSGNSASDNVTVGCIHPPTLTAGGTDLVYELGEVGPFAATWTWTDTNPDEYNITQTGVGIVDTGTWSSGVPITWDVTGIGLGGHTFRCDVDNIWGFSEFDDVIVTVSDTTAPLLVVGGTDINYELGNSGPFTATWTWTDLDPDTYTITQIGVGVVDSGAWSSGVAITWDVTGLGLGLHTFRCAVQDGSANPAQDDMVVNVTDTTSPGLSAGGTDINYGLGAPGPIWATWTWTDLDPDNYTITRIGVGLLDGGTWFSGIPIQWDVSGLGIGIYTFMCDVEDVSGNLASDNITVTVPDGVPILIAGGTNVAYELGAAGPFTATWTWTDMSPDRYNITQIGVGILDSGTWSSGVAITWDVTLLGLGVHTFRCDVDDLANLSDFDDLTVTVTDTTAPVLSAGGGNINYVHGEAGPIWATWTWTDLDANSYNITQLGVGLVDSDVWFSGVAITWDVSGLGLGVTTFTCDVEDCSGNPASDDVTVTVSGGGIPLVAGGLNIDYELGAAGPFTATWTWTDPDPNNYTITWIGVGVVDSGLWADLVPITWDVTGLGPGAHTFRCEVEDGSGFTALDDVTVTVTDTTTPVLSAGGTNINYELGAAGPFMTTWTWTDLDPATYTITQIGVGILDSGAWFSGVAITWDVTGLGLGAHTFTCDVEDGSTNPGTDNVIVTVTDTTAPVLSAGGTNINYELGAPGPFTATWTWTDLDAATYTITRIGVGVVDSGAWTSGIAITWDVTGLGVGVHTFRCAVVDGSANPAQDDVIVSIPDGVPILTAGGTNVAYELGAAGPILATWTWTDLIPATYTITQVGVGVVDSGAWASGVAITWDVSGLGLGATTFTCAVMDGSANPNSDNVIVTVTDTTAPVLSAGGTDVNYNFGDPGPIWAAWTWTDLDPDNYTISQLGVGAMDSGLWASGIAITWDVSGLGLGIHTFRCGVEDDSGNSASDNVTVTCGSPPFLTAGGTDINYELGAIGPFTATWTWTDPNPNQYNITRIGIGIVDSGIWTSGVPITWDVTGLGLGNHTFRCEVDDLWVLWDFDDIVVTVSDTTNPVLSAGGNDINYEFGAAGPIWVTWTWTEFDPDNYTINQIGVGVVDSGTWSSGVPITWDVAGLGLGTYNFQCDVDDGSDNFADHNITVTVTDTTAPSLSTGGGNIAYELGDLGPYTATWTWTDADPGAFNITQAGVGIVDNGTWLSGVALNWDVSGLGIGTYTFNCTVDDITGNSSSDNVLVIVSDTTPPVILATPNNASCLLGSTGNWLNWSWVDLDADNHTITRNGTTVGNGSWVSGVNITINIDGLATGVYEFICTVQDASGNLNSSTVYFSVLNNPPPPGPRFDLSLFMFTFLLAGVLGVGTGLGLPIAIISTRKELLTPKTHPLKASAGKGKYSLSSICPSCGNDNLSHFRFCDKCGKNL